MADTPLGLLIARRKAASAAACAFAPVTAAAAAPRHVAPPPPRGAPLRPFDEPPASATHNYNVIDDGAGGNDDNGKSDGGGEGAEGRGGRAVGGAPSKRQKKAPAELPSTRGVSRFRRVIDAPAVAARRDPRFDASSGDFSEAHFQRSYAFLDEHRAAELAAVKREAARSKDPARKRALQADATRLSQALADAAQRRRVEDAKRGADRATAEAVAAGGAAFFPKKRDLRELEVVERFKALEEAGGAAAVEKALKRKRVSLSKKDRTRLPSGARPARI